MTFHVHWLEASGDLSPWRAAIAAEIECARQAMSELVRVPPIDILVQRQADAVIPELGTAGFALGPTLFSITVNPGNANFAHSLASGDIRRTLGHEAHHCLRMAGVGFGSTLGEVLVSEGLAGRFAIRLFGTPPEPWESAVTDAVLKDHLPSEAELLAAGYDHAAWFFGAGGRHPRWLGYTLGFRIVGDWLAANPTIAGETWVDVPAKEVIAAARTLTLKAA